MKPCSMKVPDIILCFFILGLVELLTPANALSRITIDINSPSIQKLQVAVLDFKNLSRGKSSDDYSTILPGILSNDLELSGYFRTIEKEAFLVKDILSIDPYRIQFRDWTAIGADLLIYGAYTTIGRLLEVELRLFDVFSARQIFAKRFIGKIKKHRLLMHRISNEIVRVITGVQGIFLCKIAYVDNSSGFKEIIISDIDGKNRQRITWDRGINLFPRLSPDVKSSFIILTRVGGQCFI